MRGKTYQKNAQRSFKKWSNIRFHTLLDALPSPLTGTLQFPIPVSPQVLLPDQSGGTVAEPQRGIALDVSTNSQDVWDSLALEYHPFLHSKKGETLPFVESSARIYVGAPQGLGLPTFIELEGKQWCESVWRSESSAYQEVLEKGQLSPSEPYLSPVRWIDQALLNGFITQRVAAHSGVTTAAMLETHDTASLYGHSLPPFHTSPFYAADQSLRQWCLFGEEKDILSTVMDPIASLLAFSAYSSLLTLLRGVWLYGAVVTDRASGSMVLILGPRNSGKTTLALHCLAEHPELELTASQDFVLASGSPLVPALLPGSTVRGGAWAVASVPSAVRIGLGAALGTLTPNPFLGSFLRRELRTAVTGRCDDHDGDRPLSPTEEQMVNRLLQNSDKVLWNMAKDRFRVHLSEVYATQEGRRAAWRPSHIGPIAGIVLLHWNSAQGASPALQSLGTGLPAVQEGLSPLLAHQPEGLLKDHFLLRSEYDVERAEERFWEMAEMEWGGGATATRTPEVFEIRNGVDFTEAVNLIHRILKR